MEIVIKLLPDLQQQNMYPKFIIHCFFRCQSVDHFHLIYHLPLPPHVFLQFQRCPAIVPGDKIHIFCLQNAALISIQKTRVKCDRQVTAVLFVHLITRVQRIAVSKQPLPLFQIVNTVIDPIFHLPRHDPGQFDLRMPMPQKTALLILLNGFHTDIHGKSIITVFFDFFPIILNPYLHAHISISLYFCP